VRWPDLRLEAFAAVRGSIDAGGCGGCCAVFSSVYLPRYGNNSCCAVLIFLYYGPDGSQRDNQYHCARGFWDPSETRCHSDNKISNNPEDADVTGAACEAQNNRPTKACGR